MADISAIKHTTPFIWLVAAGDGSVLVISRTINNNVIWISDFRFFLRWHFGSQKLLELQCLIIIILAVSASRSLFYFSAKEQQKMNHQQIKDSTMCLSSYFSDLLAEKGFHPSRVRIVIDRQYHHHPSSQTTTESEQDSKISSSVYDVISPASC